MKLWGLAKRLLFPGLDLNTRCRYRFLPRYFRKGALDTLDAGCGNGALSYAAYRLGNRVLGVSYDDEQVRRNTEYFSAFIRETDRLCFEKLNLYDLGRVDRRFDQIICSETLEHIRGDAEIVGYFHRLLRPGGSLHLCCPNALHPENRLGRTDGPEDGGHVRDGYTLESYRALLEPAGFRIVRHAGLGTPLLERIDRAVRGIRNRWGDAAALPVFLATWPLQWLDRPDPVMPFSVYVEAVKEAS